jgi:hypothetical protein
LPEGMLRFASHLSTIPKKEEKKNGEKEKKKKEPERKNDFLKCYLIQTVLL